MRCICLVCGNQCCSCGAILASRACLRTHLKDSVRRGFCRASLAKGSPTQRIVEFSPMSCSLCGAQLSENGAALAHMAAHLRTFLPHGDLVQQSSHTAYVFACTLLFTQHVYDSRGVLCSFDCDSDQSFLASQMENWQRTFASTQPERPTKVRCNSNATGSKDDLERQLLFISTRFGLRNARDVSLLNSICYSTVKLSKDHAVCVAAAEARRANATRTR